MPKQLNKWLYEKTRNLLRWQAKVTRKNIEVDGYNIAYLESKKKHKKTLILIHGLNDEKDTWLMLASALKDKYHLILIDLLGSGESDMAIDFEYTLHNQADFLEKVITKMIKEKGIDSFSLAGHSMGGLVVLLADRLPIDKFILIDTMGTHVKFTPLEIEAQKVDDISQLPFLNPITKKDFKEAMKLTMYKPLYMPNFMIAHILANKASKLEFEIKKLFDVIDENIRPHKNLEKELNQIKQQVLIVWGKEDLTIDVSSAYKMHELIENSTLKMYEACRHYPQIDKPKELAADLVAFLG